METPRFVPAHGLVEVTTRTIQGRYLLRPGPGVRKTTIGILARAQKRHGLRLHGVVVLSNHLHLLASPRDALQLAGFMRDVKRDLAFELGRLHRWEGPFWHRRYSAIPVTGEEAAQVARLDYLLAQGVKENLVASPFDWPGVHCAGALALGETLEGTWLDRSARYRARQQGCPVSAAEQTTRYRLVLEPLPCWDHLAPEVHRRRVAERVAWIEQQARARHARGNTRPLGVEGVCRVHPHQRPDPPERRRRPWVHAASKSERQAFTEVFRHFVKSYREASRRFREGEWGVAFPPGSFPPARPFVPI